MGGKAKQAKYIAVPILDLARHLDNPTYYEPFCGSCAVLAQVAPAMGRSIASDNLEDLILLLRAVQSGWVPPDTMTRQEWEALKIAEPSALRGWAGIAASYRGKWFTSYGVMAHGDDPEHPGYRNYLAEAQRSILKRAKSFVPSVSFEVIDYREVSPEPGSIIYADPPYRGTANYRGQAFDHIEFWQTVRKWAEDCFVFVSEYEAPDDWTPILQLDRSVSFAIGANFTAKEYLFFRYPDE